MTSRSTGRTCLLATILLATATPLSAQMLPYAFSITVEPYTSQSGCQPTPGCEGLTVVPDTGTYLFNVHLGPDPEMWFSFDAVRMRLSWPESWVVSDAWVCGGAVVSGDLTVPGSVVEIALDECWHPRFWSDPPRAPAVQLVIDCNVPGQLSLVESYPDRVLELRVCEGAGWGPPIGEWTSDFFYTSEIAVGDFCGITPRAACGYCDRNTFPSGRFMTEPIDLDLELGQSATETVVIRETWCIGMPAECGGLQYSDGCVRALMGGAPWVTVAPVDATDSEYTFAVTVSTDDLTLGEHRTRIHVQDTGCVDCLPNCQELRVVVSPPPAVQESSWSRIKARY